MSVIRYTSIFFVLLLFFVVPVRAQLNLELLENSPTPTPLPEGQQYILEIEQISDAEILQTTLDPKETRLFDLDGYVIRKGQDNVSLNIEKTQLAYNSFKDNPSQSQSTQIRVGYNNQIRLQLQMDVIKEFSSGSITIPFTTCNTSRPCTPKRASIWDDNIEGWGYSLTGKGLSTEHLSGQGYKPPHVEHTPILFTSSNNEDKTVIMNWKITTKNQSDDIFSGVIRLITLPY